MNANYDEVQVDGKKVAVVRQGSSGPGCTPHTYTVNIGTEQSPYFQELERFGKTWVAYGSPRYGTDNRYVKVKVLKKGARQ